MQLRDSSLYSRIGMIEEGSASISRLYFCSLHYRTLSVPPVYLAIKGCACGQIMGSSAHLVKDELACCKPSFLPGSQPRRSLADTRAHALDTALRLRRSIHRLQPPGQACFRERAHDGARPLQVGA